MKYLLYTNDKLTGVFSNLGDAVSEEEDIKIVEMEDTDLLVFQRKWRDEELERTDWIIPITDHPDRASHITYRANLRNWPSTDSFPETRPTL